MWPFSSKRQRIEFIDHRYVKGESISWNGAIGLSRAKCNICKRDLEQEETKITFVHRLGEVQAKGKVWCKVCGSKQKFDLTD